MKVGDRVKYVTRDEHGFETTYRGAVELLVPDAHCGLLLVFRVDHCRVEHPIAPHEGRNLPPPRLSLMAARADEVTLEE